MPNIVKLWFEAEDRSKWTSSYLKRKKHKVLHRLRHPMRIGIFEKGFNTNYRLASFKNLDLLLDTNCLVDKDIYAKGGWETEQVSVLQKAAEYYKSQGGFHFFDVGSYWGLYSMLATTWGADGVVAFEPDPQNHQHLVVNLMINDLRDKVIVHHLAASDAESTLSFKPSGARSDGNRGAAGITNATDDQSVMVAARPIDEVSALTGKRIILKMDVEGHELNALRGMRKLCENNIIFAQIEIFGSRDQPIFELAKSLGLKLVHTIAPDYYFTNDPNPNLIETLL